MDSTCIRYTELPSSALFRDYLYRFDRVSRFYSHNPFDPESYSSVHSQLQQVYPDDRRAALVEALAPDNAGNPSLELLAKPGTAVVITGQQVGLLGGPAYTVYKALTAIRVARHMQESGLPTVPAFWVATEDHDLEEIEAAWLFGPAGRPKHVRTELQAAPGTPAGIASGEYPLKCVEELLEGMPFASEIVELARESYAPGATMGEAFKQLLRRLFADYGLLIVDPLRDGLRQLGAPLMKAAFSRMPALVGDLVARSRQLEDAGYHSQVLVEQASSLCFYLKDGVRYSLKKQNGEWYANRKPLTADPDPARLSPNALLRPVLQDYLLPTAAFVAGPAELAYLAQSAPLYESLLGRMPVMVPRQGFTLADHRARKLLDRYQLQLKDFFPGEQHLNELIAGRLVPAHVRAEAELADRSAHEALRRLEGVLERFDPTLAEAVAGSRRKIRYQLSKIHAKVGREILRREERLQEEAAWLFARIYPHRQFQERTYSILPFLAEHGPDLIDRLAEQVNPFCPDHQLVVV